MYVNVYVHIYIDMRDMCDICDIAMDHVPTLLHERGLGVWQCVAVCCRLLQSVAACCSLLQSVAVCCSVLQSVAVCCRVLQSVAVCCSVCPWTIDDVLPCW